MNYNFEFEGKARSIYVDAGCFMIGDRQSFIDFGADEQPMNRMHGHDHNYHWHKVNVEPGKYLVKAKCPDSWNGKVKEKKILTIPSGELWITDGCYVFLNDNAWENVCNLILDDEMPNHNFIVMQTGGDGEFDLKLKLEGVKLCQKK